MLDIAELLEMFRKRGKKYPALAEDMKFDLSEYSLGRLNAEQREENKPQKNISV